MPKILGLGFKLLCGLLFFLLIHANASAQNSFMIKATNITLYCDTTLLRQNDSILILTKRKRFRFIIPVSDREKIVVKGKMRARKNEKLDIVLDHYHLVGGVAWRSGSNASMSTDIKLDIAPVASEMIDIPVSERTLDGQYISYHYDLWIQVKKWKGKKMSLYIFYPDGRVLDLSE
jgi:hypothetical protein